MCIDTNLMCIIVLHQNAEDTMALSPVLAYIIQRLTCDRHADTVLPLSFRLCMANVLISTCQKISSSAKPLFARKMLPAVIHSIEVDNSNSGLPLLIFRKITYNHLLFLVPTKSRLYFRFYTTIYTPLTYGLTIMTCGQRMNKCLFFFIKNQ